MRHDGKYMNCPELGALILANYTLDQKPLFLNYFLTYRGEKLMH